jgi:hypothetical protein
LRWDLGSSRFGRYIYVIRPGHWERAQISEMGIIGS